MNKQEKDILILVNKKFEYDGFKVGVEHVLKTTNDISKYIFDSINVSVCCIEEVLFKKDPQNSSNSLAKHDRLRDHLKGRNAPDYIFSVSTSESTYEGQGDKPTNDGDPTASANGCVYVGGRFFLADCREINRGKDHYGKSELNVGESDNENTRFYPLTRAVGILTTLNNSYLVDAINKDLISVPKFSCQRPFYNAEGKNSCVGVVNVTNYAQYPIADGYAYGLFYMEAKNRGAYGKPIGIETTHGVVRKVAENAYAKTVPPVIFVSPITDRFGRFAEDVTSTKDKKKLENQNYACSYNSGIAVAHMMKYLDVNWKTNNLK